MLIQETKGHDKIKKERKRVNWQYSGKTITEMSSLVVIRAE